MGITREVVKNTVVQIIGKMFTAGIGLICTLLIAKFLGPVGYGRYVFIFVFLSFFIVISDLGITPISVREISRDQNKTDQFLSNVIVMKLFIAIAAIALAVIIVKLLRYPSEITASVYIASALLLFSVFKAVEIIFQARLKMKYVVIAQIIEGIVHLLLICFIIYYVRKGRLTDFVSAAVFAGLVSSVLLFLSSKKFFRPKLKIDLRLWGNILRESLPQGIASVLVIIYFKIDIIMLSLMKGDAAVGLYGAAYKFLDLAIFIPAIFMISIFPLMSKFYSENKERLKEIYQKSFYYLMLIAIPLAVCVTFLARPIILLMYGEKFTGSIAALQILIWAVVAIFASQVTGYMMVSINRQRLGMYIAGLGCAINIGLNLLLIPRVGFIGAAWATVVTETFLSMALLYGVFKCERLLPFFRLLPKVILLGIPLGILVALLRNLAVYFTIPLVLIVYFLLIFVLKCISKDDLQSLLGAHIY